MNSKLAIASFLFIFISIFLFEIPFFNQAWNPIMTYRLIQLSFFMLIVMWGDRILYVDRETKVYLIVLLLGTLFHMVIKVDAHPVDEFCNWAIIVTFLAIYRGNYTFCTSIPFYIIITFFIVECSIGIYERMVGHFLISYEDTDYLTLSEGHFGTNLDFRSVSLMIHPLKNANAVSIIMAFVLVSKRLSVSNKVVLLLLGVGALWAFNSRGSMLCWFLILIYRFSFFDRNIIFVAICFLLFYFFYPFLFEFIESTGLLGRFISKDFDDESTNARLLAFVWFAMQDWNIESVLMGGKMILMPGSNLTLENGILVTLGYWGWFVGTFKVILEFLISYNSLTIYNVKEKLILMIAFWGVALTNNNSFHHWPLALFVLTFIAFNMFEKFSTNNIR